jgi:hypothetical protein
MDDKALALLEKIFEAKQKHYVPQVKWTGAELDQVVSASGASRPRKRKFQKNARAMRRITWKMWNAYSWQLDITDLMAQVSPGYLAHLAGLDDAADAELCREWAAWCRRPENYIPQPLGRPHFWDYYAAWTATDEYSSLLSRLRRCTMTIHEYRGLQAGELVEHDRFGRLVVVAVKQGWLTVKQPGRSQSKLKPVYFRHVRRLYETGDS